MIAVDANAVVALLVDESDLGAASRRLYAEHDLAAPDLLPYEVASVLRKLCQLNVVTSRTAEHALQDLHLVRISPVPYVDISGRIWQLRENLSIYDAAYVAVAELFDVPLLTFDGRIRRAQGPNCEFVTPN
jgi:predicted nucleic acid-binding protein